MTSGGGWGGGYGSGNAGMSGGGAMRNSMGGNRYKSQLLVHFKIT